MVILGVSEEYITQWRAVLSSCISEATTFTACVTKFYVLLGEGLILGTEEGVFNLNGGCFFFHSSITIGGLR